MPWESFPAAGSLVTLGPSFHRAFHAGLSSSGTVCGLWDVLAEGASFTCHPCCFLGVWGERLLG